MQRNGDLPEWGSAANSYGRVCMTKPPRQIGANSSGGVGSSDNCGNGGQKTSNETSSDNPFAVCRTGGVSRHTPGPDRGVCTLPAVSGGGERAATVHSRNNNGGLRGSCHDIAVPDWTCATVEQWLSGMSLGFLSERFSEEAIDGEALLELQDEDLVVLGVTKLGIRRKLMKQIKCLQAGMPHSVSPDCTPVMSSGVISSSSRNSSRHGHDSNMRRPDSVHDPVSHKCHDVKDDAGYDPLGPRGAADSRASPTTRLKSHESISSHDGSGSRDGASRSAKAGSKGKVGADGVEKNGNHTSPEHPLAFGSRWGTSQYTDGPFNGPEMRSRKRASWNDLPPAT